jgi:flagellar hook-associated protein 3 FlgL
VSGRITNQMMNRTLLYDLQSTTERLAQANRKLSSGKAITRPSDDPFGASRALQLRNEVAATQQYQRNTDEAGSWQTIADTALANVGDYTLRARTLLTQGANGSTSPGAREAIATEIDQIIDSIKSEANTKYGDRYIFGGTETTTPPYQQGASDVYAGNTNLIAREIGPGLQLDVNTPGIDVIGGDPGSGTNTGLLEVLRRVATNLRSGDIAALGNADLRDLSAAHDTVTNARAIVGARANRLETASSRLQELEETATRLLSKTEDADMAATIVDLSTQQAVYQSALKAGANMLQSSLMDYLG